MADFHSAGWAGFSTYDDIGEVMEIGAVYDDTLKKNETFTNFATAVGQEIADNIPAKVNITYGKWGARIEPNKNKHLNREEIQELARQIIRHPSWAGLCLATWTFTYSK